MAAKKSNEREPRRRVAPGTLALWLLVLLSLLLNVVVLSQLLRLRRIAQVALSDASAILSQVQNETISLSVPIDDTVVIDAELPVQETVSVPIRAEVPVSTTVTVPVDAGVLGTIPLNIPIEASFPVNLTTEVPINQTFAVHAPVKLDMVVQVEVAVAETPLYDTLAQAQATLDNVAQQLGGRPIRRP